MSTLSISRRTILAGAAAAAPLALSSRLFGAEAPNNRLRIAFIGTGNQGMGLLKRVLDHDLADVLAVCDVNKGSYGYKEESHFYGREPAQELVEKTSAGRAKGSQAKCDAYADAREVLDRKDIDAVVIVVPDHWHAALTVAAAKAGKAIYCEKPLTLTQAEGRDMIKAVRDAKIILQTGSHERSNPVSRFVCEKVKAGAIGDLKRVVTKVGYNNKVGPGPGWKPEPVPEGFDYATWLGPAPEAPYHHDRCLYRFRFNYDYSGGQITNFGAHCNDMAHWGMGEDLGGPTEIRCLDAKFLPEGSLFNTATETTFLCKYASGVELLCESGPEQVQTRFEGSDGWMQTGYKGTTASDPELLEGLPEKEENGLDPHAAHLANFVACAKSGEEPRAPVEIGHASATLCHLANVVIRRFPTAGSETLRWDPQAEKFLDHAEANAMLERPKRDPWA